MNLCIFRGNLTRDIELRTTTNDNTPVCNFSIAVREFRKGEQTTEFFDFEAWGSIAENLAKGGNKGRCILVRGKAKNHSFTTKDKVTGQEIQRKGNRYRVEEFEWTTFNTQNKDQPSELPQDDEQDYSVAEVDVVEVEAEEPTIRF